MKTTAVLGLLIFCVAGNVEANPVAPKEASSIRDALKVATSSKTKVNVVMEGGQSYSAHVAAVGDDTVLLIKPTGKEYYDVLVKLDDISAVEMSNK